MTIVGAIATGRILVLGRPNFPINVPLALFVAFDDGVGEFDAKFRMFDSSDKQMGKDFSLGKVHKTHDQAMQFLINFGVIPVTKLGKFKVQIFLDDHVYEDGFSVAYAPDSVSKP